MSTSTGAGVVGCKRRRPLRRIVMMTALLVTCGLIVEPSVASAGQHTSSARLSASAASQAGAPWNLDRIDQRAATLDGSYAWNADGHGVSVYVIDSGIRASHREFGGRVATGHSVVNDGRGTDDCTGHGTHIAATIGGARFGVAKNVTLVPVRVLDCKGVGTVSALVRAIDWVAANHKGPSVANLSLSVGQINNDLDDAINRAVKSGITFVVAAGNQNVDACTVSPARNANVIAVGSTNLDDVRAYDSNFGPCVSVFAPGVSVESAWNTSDSASASASGTSMASPHVSGVAALLLQQDPSASPSVIAARVRSSATPNVVRDAGTGTTNRLLYSGVSIAPSLVGLGAAMQSFHVRSLMPVR